MNHTQIYLEVSTRAPVGLALASCRSPKTHVMFVWRIYFQRDRDTFLRPELCRKIILHFKVFR